MHTPARAASDAAYPPPPWGLSGTMICSLFFVPARAVPELDAHLPDGHRPVLLGHHAVVGLAVARYEPGGDLTYDELLVAVLTRRGLALRATVTQIWVDSPASQAGGRTLWTIPKDLATTRQPSTGPATAHPAERTEFRLPDGAPILRLDRRVDPRPGRRLTPTRVAIPIPTAQREGPATVTTHNSVTATVRPARAHWQVATRGPLGWLTGRRPLGTVTLTDAHLTFGARVNRST